MIMPIINEYRQNWWRFWCINDFTNVSFQYICLSSNGDGDKGDDDD